MKVPIHHISILSEKLMTRLKTKNCTVYPEKSSLCMVRIMASIASVNDEKSGWTAEDINASMVGKAWKKNQ